MSRPRVPRIIPASHKPRTKDGSDGMKLLIVDDHVAMRLAAMSAYDRADRLESLANTWNDGGRAWNAATTPTSVTDGG